MKGYIIRDILWSNYHVLKYPALYSQALLSNWRKQTQTIEQQKYWCISVGTVDLSNRGVWQAVPESPLAVPGRRLGTAELMQEATCDDNVTGEIMYLMVVLWFHLTDTTEVSGGFLMAMCMNS